MDIDVPYLPSVKNLNSMLDAMQKAAVPEAFGHDFLKDMGFTSSNDRGIIKVLKYLGMLDASGKPQSSYREFINQKKAKSVLADRLMNAYDDLFLSDKKANEKTIQDLKGWFKTKTGKGDAVAEKIAITFKALAAYADFKEIPPPAKTPPLEPPKVPPAETPPPPPLETKFGLTYRLEINLPDTTNVDTYRAIFRAIREELLS